VTKLFRSRVTTALAFVLLTACGPAQHAPGVAPRSGGAPPPTIANALPGSASTARQNSLVSAALPRVTSELVTPAPKGARAVAEAIGGILGTAAILVGGLLAIFLITK
jgi:hypothetical protein